MDPEARIETPIEPANGWRLRGMPLLLGFVTAAAVLTFVYQLDRSGTEAHRQQIHGTVLRDLAAVRGAAEVAVNRRVHRLFALRAHIAINPDLTPEQFANLSQMIIDEVEGIRSVTSIRDNVINDVYPRKGNEGAIGFDVLAHPTQRAAALHAIQTGKPWLDGPVQLVQGGEAFVYRAPVYRYFDEIGGIRPRHASENYWGMVSLLIEKKTLVDEILQSVPDDLSIAIHQYSDSGAPKTHILGAESLSPAESLHAKITLPTGTWQLYGMPSQGWPTVAPGAMKRRVAGISIAVILGLLVFGVSGAAARDRLSAQRLQRANAEAESARKAAELAKEKLVREADAISRYAGLLEQAHYESARIMQDLEKTQSELSESNVALKRSNEELEQFAYVASHDLQEPLRKVAAFCQLIDLEYGDKVGEEGRRYLAYVVDGAHRMRNLIRDLLTFSKIQSQADVLKPVDAGRALREAMCSLEGSIEEREADVRPGEMPMVRGDSRLLSQLFQNLIGNGIKYNESPKPTVEIHATRIGDHWKFTVSDNGIGIDAENRDRVFGIFKRLHSRSEYKGTGIGLAICKRITERLGGEIGIEDNDADQAGTTFFFTVEALKEEEIVPVVDFDRHLVSTHVDQAST